jgi:membrane-associated phospholipid phosphatase
MSSRSLALLLRRLLGGLPLVSYRLRPWVLVVSIVAVASLAGFGFAARNSGRPLLFESTVDMFLQRNSGFLGIRVARLLSNVGDPKEFLTVTALIAFALIVVGDYRAAVAAVVSVGVALVLVEEMLKPFFNRHLGSLPKGGLIFPSGHTVVPLALAGVVVMAAGSSRPLGRRLGRVWRGVLVAAVLIVASSMGLAEVVLQSHYLTDVVAGIPLGLAVSGSTALLLDALADHRHATQHLQQSRSRVAEPDT